MRDCLKGLLLSSIGNGRVKVIVGASGSGAESFLFEDFASSLKEKAPLAEFVDLRALSSKEIEDICVEKKKGGKECFFACRQSLERAKFRRHHKLLRWNDFSKSIFYCPD